MRLINADAFRKEVQDYVLPITENNLMGAADAYHRILHLLDDAPTIEAEPVKHGDWYGCGNMWMCTECNDLAYVMHNYCPNCGAKMDGGADNG